MIEKAKDSQRLGLGTGAVWVDARQKTTARWSDTQTHTHTLSHKRRR